MHFVSTYKINLKDVFFICAYSDGCEPNFESKQEILKWINKPEELINNGKEKTLVMYSKQA